MADKRYKPDWADRLAAATTGLRKSGSAWEYEHPCNAWESMPWFVRWPLAAVLTLAALFFGSVDLIGLARSW